MPIFQNLNAPLQKIGEIKGVELWIKREDLIHKEISGNKWRKLKYYFEDFQKSGKLAILTFGGAFSNHLAAVAALGKMTGTDTMAMVRGEEISSNSTLDFCRENGVEILPLSRKKYATKDEPEFLQMLNETLPQVYVIPEGGKGLLGVWGCTEILENVPDDFDVIACSGGTGTTMTGLLLSGYSSEFQLYPALKGGRFLLKEIEMQVAVFQDYFSTAGGGKISAKVKLTVEEKFHFGGYAKVNTELIDFMNDFYEKYHIPLDPIYTGKMMFGIFKNIENGNFAKGTKILAVHTGGLQGIKGMNKILSKIGLQINYES